LQDKRHYSPGAPARPSGGENAEIKDKKRNKSLL